MIRRSLWSLMLLALIAVCGQAQAQTNTTATGEPEVTAADGTKWSVADTYIDITITTATAAVFTLLQAHAGKLLHICASFTDNASNDEERCLKIGHAVVNVDGSATTDLKKIILVCMVFIFGFVGGFMSMTQRYSREKAEAKEEVAGKITLSDYIRSSIFGGVFAIILMLIFQGGLGVAIGDFNLFPTYPDAKDISPMGFFELLSYYPETGADVAKLLVWSFVAGFSERMVPGVLGKLSNRIKGGTKK